LPVGGGVKRFFRQAGLASGGHIGNIPIDKARLERVKIWPREKTLAGQEPMSLLVTQRPEALGSG